MSKNRYVNTKFWDDPFIANCDPVEKLLFLYFLTNPLTNVCGIYEIVLKRVAFDTGIDKEMVLKILDRFEKYDKMKYLDGWIVIKNFVKHQKLNPNIEKGIEDGFKKAPEVLVKWAQSESLYKPSQGFAMSLLNSNSNLDSNSSCKPDGIPYQTIINEMNTHLKTSYKHTSKATQRLIHARWQEGFREADFEAVVRTKKAQWQGDPKMKVYLRPETLFGTKFESYLQAARAAPKKAYTIEDARRDYEEMGIKL